MLLLAVQGTAFAAETTDEVNKMNRVDFTNNRFNELFKGEECPIAETDKDFYESVKRFVYGDVAQLGNLSLEQRELITIVVLTANQQPEILKKHIGGALNAGVAPEKIEHPAQRVSLSQAHLRHPRLGVRHGCKNAFGDPRAQEPDGHPKPLRPLAHGAQTSHDEPPRKAAVKCTSIFLVGGESHHKSHKNV